MNGIRRPYRILFIDDDPQIRRIVHLILGEDGHELFEASSGAEGVMLAIRQRPDLILLDVMMPEMDGYEVCRRLRENPRTANIPVIMVTALGNMGEKIRGLETGADDYITKPFDAGELRSRVQAHLRRSVRDLNASPLTSLPGSPAIEQVIRDRLENHEPMAVLYFDLSDFKAYNDEYGWLKGDKVIKMLAEEIEQTVAAEGDGKSFIGHVGGDDFIAVTLPERAEPIAQEIIKRFDVEILEHYSEAAREKGYIEGKDRKGESVRFPIMSLGIAIVSSAYRELYHPSQIAAVAAEVKKYVKTLPGSHYAFDRRRN